MFTKISGDWPDDSVYVLFDLFKKVRLECSLDRILLNQAKSLGFLSHLILGVSDSFLVYFHAAFIGLPILVLITQVEDIPSHLP